MVTTVSDGGERAAADGGWVLLVSGADLVRAVALPIAGEVVIGRDATCEVALDHERLSRRHARLVIDAAWTIEDLGSRNGTLVRGAAITAPTEVVPGEPIAFGPYVAVIVPRAVSMVRTAIGGSQVTVDDPTLISPTPLLIAVARAAVSVVITGETGAGKEVLARSIHRLSGRTGPLLGINCAALAPALLESELFGHVRGAFTGAVADKVGLLEAAAGGTVLFDELGEMPLELQAKLLRAIETREVVRVGAVRAAGLDVRFLAATHRDLAAASQRGEFRRDLFYRLAGITLTVAPLRDCPHQLAQLAARFARECGTGASTRVGPTALARLAAHDWPGNVRELRNVIERATLLAAGGEPRAEDILLDTAPAPPPSPPARSPAPSIDDLATALSPDQAAERARIVDALEACAGNQTHAAKRLGISRATLVTKLAIYRVPRPRDRGGA